MHTQYDIKVRLLRLGKSQRWLIKQIQDRPDGEKVEESAFSSYLGGFREGPKRDRVLALCDKILAEHGA